MKRSSIVVTLLILAGGDRVAQASEPSQGYGAKAYAAGALATAGVMGGAYTLLNRYKSRTEAEEARKEIKNGKMAIFNKVFESSRRNLEGQLQKFLDTSDSVYRVCGEYLLKFEDLESKLKVMSLNIQLAHSKRQPYSEQQKNLRDDINIVLLAVKKQSKLAQGWIKDLDGSFEKFMKNVALLFEDKTFVEPEIKFVLSEWKPRYVDGSQNQQEWIKHLFEPKNREWIPMKTLHENLPSIGSLMDVENELKRHYEMYTKSYEELNKVYKRLYGSYFTQFKEYVGDWFAKKPEEARVTPPAATSMPSPPAATAGQGSAIQRGSAETPATGIGRTAISQPAAKSSASQGSTGQVNTGLISIA